MGSFNSKSADGRNVAATISRRTVSDWMAELIDATEIASAFPDERGRTLQFLYKAEGYQNIEPPNGPLLLHLPFLRVLVRKVDAHGEMISEREVSVVQFYHIYNRIQDHFRTASNGGDNQLNVSLLGDLDASRAVHPPMDECIICMTAAANVSLPCSHAYCENCIDAWSLTSDECPLCRRHSCVLEESWVLADTPTAVEMAADVHQLVEKL